MIITKHKRDINLLVLQLGAAFAVSFAGFLFSRFRKQRRRIRPSLPPLRPRSSGLSQVSDRDGHKDHSKSSIDREEEDPEYSVMYLSPNQKHDSTDKDLFLLPEFADEVKKFDLTVSNDCETPKSDVSAPLAFPSEEEIDHLTEIKRLRNTVRILHEREMKLEEKLLEYYSLKEQQKIAMELRNRLKLNQMQTKVSNLKIESLKTENEKLKARFCDHEKVVAERDAAKSQVLTLKKKLNIKTQQHVEQILSLRDRVAKLQEDEIKALLPESDAVKMMLRLRDLESEINELRDSNTRLHLENFELVEKLEAIQLVTDSKLKDLEEIETLREESNKLKSENEEFKKEIEQLQEDRCTDLEQLVYLRWINACLRHELRPYQRLGAAGKTAARDLSATLSPTSEEKAKQLILEYAHSELREENGNHTSDIEYDQWSSSQEDSLITDSIFLDDSSVDTLFATKTKKSTKKKKLMQRLMKILHGKDSYSKRENTKRGGSSEPSSSSTCVVHSVPKLRSTHSMDFEMLLRGKDEEELKGEISVESDENRKKELIKFAEALRNSRPTKKLHKKSVSFFF